MTSNRSGQRKYRLDMECRIQIQRGVLLCLLDRFHTVLAPPMPSLSLGCTESSAVASPSMPLVC